MFLNLILDSTLAEAYLFDVLSVYSKYIKTDSISSRYLKAQQAANIAEGPLLNLLCNISPDARLTQLPRVLWIR